MSLSYFNVKNLRRKPIQQDDQADALEETPRSPVLDDADEKFLERLAALAAEPEGTPPPLPERHAVTLDNGEKKTGQEAREISINDPGQIPLPMSPPEVTVEDTDKTKSTVEQGEADGKTKKSVMGYFSLAQSKFKSATHKEHKDKGKGKEKVTDHGKEQAANDLHSAAEAAKTTEEKEADKEREDLTAILDQLNLGAVNNRVFSFSKESQELMDKFKLVLKDIVNGAPTAYNDLELLLTDSEAQLKKMYGSLPPFLQNLVKSLPAKMTAALGPELLAAQAEKPGFDMKNASSADWKNMAKHQAKKHVKKKAKVPTLKSLVSAQGAVATMLKSILNFLKLRFPALITGTNVLMSLAVFLLLFVFWYCHKRGRETRLEKEKLAAEEGGSGLPSDASSFDTDGDSLLNEKVHGESSRSRETPEPPLVIKDDKEAPEAGVNDMPSVTHLPEPASAVPLPQSTGATPVREREEPMKEAPYKS
ncbi:hypothetical protein BCR34DRAFT_492762 [Clohesyomyces aquaticus]|uniref:Ring-like domain-containing protein n=1 Tax=Clohesyomyces aquaticus TaxID=1231657 RepID=A0A1Y1YZE2_9PLEO|nr:hypothetical protein BCR34DRAFT_492762 [Clohesyomyces aquaticus]